MITILRHNLLSTPETLAYRRSHVISTLLTLCRPGPNSSSIRLVRLLHSEFVLYVINSNDDENNNNNKDEYTCYADVGWTPHVSTFCSENCLGGVAPDATHSHSRLSVTPATVGVKLTEISRHVTCTKNVRRCSSTPNVQLNTAAFTSR